MNNVRDKFQSMIRQILKEELAKRDTLEERVPEQDGNGLDIHKDKNKTFANDENSRDKKTKEELIDDLTKLVHGINKDYLVVWDDHDDLKIDARDLMSLRITPDWEDHYEIEVFTRNEDRIWVTGLDWNQVKGFVEKNMKALSKVPTYVEKAYDKSYRNSKDQTDKADKGLPQDDKPKLKPLTNETPSTSKNKEKDYTEKDVKNEEDEPNKPMKEVGDFKKLADYKVKDPVKLRKRTPDKKLVVKQS